MAHLFLVLISIPLSGCTRVNLSIHLLKDILVPSKFGQLWISCYKHPCSGFCKDIMWSQVGLRKHHYEQSWWRWWNPSWAISNPKRWCCESAALNMPANLENSAVATELEKVVSILYRAHLCMKCSLGISNFLEEISSLSPSIGSSIFFFFFASFAQNSFLSLLAILWNSVLFFS